MQKSLTAISGLVLVAGVLAAAGGAAVGKPAARAATLSSLDKHYLMNSAQGDAFEIQGGKKASSKGSDGSIKKLGQRLVKDHSKSLSDVKKLATKYGVSVKSSPTPPEQWEINMTASLSGHSFDHAYASLEVADHKQDIEDTTEEIKSGTNSAVRALARQDLPMLQTHLKLSQAALKAVG